MAKRRGPIREAQHQVKQTIRTAGRALVGGIGSQVREEADRLMESARKHVLVLEEKMLDNLVTVVLGLLAALFLVTALLFLLLDQVGLSRAAAFGLCGVALLLLAFWRRYQALKE